MASTTFIDQKTVIQADWANDVNNVTYNVVPALATSAGSSMVGYDSGTVQTVLDDAKPLANYTALRAYTGRATGVRITQTGLAGHFQRDASDTTTADNGGTVIVDAIGRRWKRLFTGAANVRWFGAKGDGATIDTVPIQKAVTAHTTIFFPNGTYLIDDTIREATNGGARRLIGENEWNSVIKASAAMNGKPLLWFGNSNGHGNYYGQVETLKLDGNAKAQGNIGLRWQEAGTTITRDVHITNCGIAIQGLGCIHNRVEGNTFISSCVEGVKFTRLPHGVPSGPNDITVTANAIDMVPNMSKIVNAWITSCDQTALRIEGGLFLVEGCTFQSATNSGAAYDVISVSSANESYDYGGGPTIRDNWIEGGSYRYAIAVRSTRQARVTGNFIAGADAADGSKEGGILLKASKDCHVKGNSVRGYFSRAASEGRAVNGSAIYLASDCGFFNAIGENYITRNTCGVYYEGEVAPALSKRRDASAFAVCSISGTTVTIQNSLNVTSITRNSIGDYTVQYDFNRDTGYSPSYVLPESNGGGVAYAVSRLAAFTAGADRILFSSGGSLADPAGFTIVTMGDGSTFA